MAEQRSLRSSCGGGGVWVGECGWVGGGGCGGVSPFFFREKLEVSFGWEKNREVCK